MDRISGEKLIRAWQTVKKEGQIIESFGCIAKIYHNDTVIYFKENKPIKSDKKG